MKTHDDLRYFPDGPPPARHHQVRKGVWSVAVLALLAAVAIGSAVSFFSSGPKTGAVVKGAPVLDASPTPNFDHVVRQVVAFDAWLRQHPTPSLVDQYMTSDNPFYGDARDKLGRFASGALRYDPLPAAPEVASTQVIGTGPNDATVKVTLGRIPRYRVVDAMGTVVLDSPGGTGKASIWHLRYEHHLWLLANTEDAA